MSQSIYPISSGHARSRQGAIVVEMSTKPLPPRMRLAGLRSSIHVSAPGRHVLQRLLMAPVAIMMRVLSR